jgi:hypothetical protein
MNLRKALLTTLLLGGYVSYAQTARVQVIHNCADAAASEVDVYLDNTKLLDDFAFRTATPFIDAPAGGPITLSVAPKNSTSVNDAIYSISTTLNSGSTYVLVANGIVSTSGYAPKPAFKLDVFAMGREMASTPGNTDILVMHGSTDAPTVDVRTGVETVVDDISYGEFDMDYLEVPTANYTIRVTTETGSNTVQTYSAPLSTLSLTNSALVVVASGFLNPANNSNGPAFGLYAALPSGGH